MDIRNTENARLPLSRDPACGRQKKAEPSRCGNQIFRKFDYDRMAREAQAECEAIQKRLDSLQGQRFETPDEELCRRKRMAVLEDEYIEQRANFRIFSERAQKRRNL